jgi:hypothetical protein
VPADHSDISAGNGHYLGFLRDICEVSGICSTTTYIWGGFTVDILEGRFLREHGDLDGFTLNLLDALPDLRPQYEARGYTTRFRDDIHMLEIHQHGLHASFNALEIDGPTAMWRHIGPEGTVFFPAAWLDDAPRPFYNAFVYLAGVRLDYALKSNVHLVSAEWQPRDCDRDATEHLDRIVAREGLDPDDFLKEIWSYNPFWVKRGYPEYAMPAVARPLVPAGQG